MNTARLFLMTVAVAHADLMLTKFSAESGAVCTDGTPAGFYFEASASGNNSKWVIELEGGGLCESNADCVSRQGSDLGSSKNWVQSITDGGQLSSDPQVNPDFFDYNRVFVPYCSGDVWIGTQQTPANPWGDDPSEPTFIFAGHTIVQEVAKELQSYVGDAAVVKELLLEGCSAGGIGTFHSTDFFAEQFPAAKVRGNPQAGYFGLAIDDYAHFIHNTTDPDPHHLRDNGWMSNISYYVAPAVAKCMAADPHAGKTLCSEPPRLYPFVTTPLFISENTADSYQVMVQGGCPQSEDAGPVSFVRYVRDIIGTSLHNNVMAGAKAKTDGLFAPACLAHCLAWNGDKAPTIKGKTHQQAMGDWYFGRGFKSHLLINDDDSIDTLLSCTDVTAATNATEMKHRHY